MRVTQSSFFSRQLCLTLQASPSTPLYIHCTYICPPPPPIVFVPSALFRYHLYSNCISIGLCSTVDRSIMAVSVLGKRSRGAPDLQEQQRHSSRRCTRRTRSFQQGNDENEDPESTIGVEAEDQSESEEVAFFSPSVTRTPSARRTKDIFKFEAPDYRALHAPLRYPLPPADSPLLKQLPRSP